MATDVDELTDRLDQLAERGVEKLEDMLEDDELTERDRIAVVKTILTCRGQAHRTAREADDDATTDSKGGK